MGQACGPILQNPPPSYRHGVSRYPGPTIEYPCATANELDSGQNHAGMTADPTTVGASARGANSNARNNRNVIQPASPVGWAKQRGPINPQHLMGPQAWPILQNPPPSYRHGVSRYPDPTHRISLCHRQRTGFRPEPCRNDGKLGSTMHNTPSSQALEPPPNPGR